MRDGALKLLLTGTLLIAAAACSDPQNDAASDDDVLGVQFAAGPGPCDLIQPISSDVRDVFMKDEEMVARDTARDMGSACKAANQSVVTSKAWSLLMQLENALNNNLVEGTPAQTALLAERLVACTVSLCESSKVQNLGLVGAVTNGMFAVRSAKQPTVARSKLDFVFSGVANKVLYFVEVDENWSLLGNNPYVLLYGQQAPNPFPLLATEFKFSVPQFEINIWPDKGPFAMDQKVHVGACFDIPLVVPATSDIEARMLRKNENGNVVVLSEPNRPFVSCPAAAPPQAASIVSPIVAFARRLLPSLFSTTRLAGDTNIRVVVGSPWDYSTFGPAGANVVGSLEWVTAPPATPTAGVSFPVSVRAKTGDGRPMELVLVELYFVGNNGFPAGADLTGDMSSFTLEETGKLGIATFSDNAGVSDPTLGKAGGYNVCARASTPGFTFPDLCAAVNVKN